MKHQIVVYRGVLPVTTFKAPDDSYTARNLWIFLVENLRPGYRVALLNGQFPNGMIKASGHEFTQKEYARFMGEKAEK